MRFLMLLCLLLRLTIPLQAQDEVLTPYEIALQRIEAARESGATELDLHNLGLTELPPEIGQLTNLELLWLYDNQLTTLPPEIGQLINLKILGLNGNQLVELPSEIGQLNKLQQLRLHNNQLTRLPSEIGQLTNLCILILGANPLRHLPTTISNLNSLTQEGMCSDGYPGLYLIENSLISPPPEVVEQGTAAVLAYLRNQAWYHLQRLIIAGASGVGLLAMLIMGVRWKQRGGRKPKKKRDAAS